MAPSLNELIDWARQAGALLREGYGKRHSINLKSRTDMVTEMDKLSEDYLIQQIQTHYPDHTINSEESGVLSGQQKYNWYIDPLDGTTNYAHHLPIFSVSLAFAEEGNVQLGVVYDPMRDECFSAERGKGAWLNGERIQVSETQELIQSLLVTGFPYDLGKTNLEHFAHFTRLTQGVRRLGSAALDLCYVACGRFDGYWEVTLNAWDIAAGALIVEEAGGYATNFQGASSYLLAPNSIVAGNPTLHPMILSELTNGKVSG